MSFRSKVITLIAGIILLGTVVLFYFFREAFDNFISLLNVRSTVQEEEFAIIRNSLLWTFTVIGIVVFSVSLIAAFYFTRKTIRSVQYINECLDLIQKGVLPENISTGTKDEIGEMAGKINVISHQLIETANYAHSIEKGQYDKKLQLASDQDVLRGALVNMTNALKDADAKEKERLWIVNCVAEVGDILRNSATIESMSDSVIRYMINTVGAVQGAFYGMYENEEATPVIRMLTTYGYNRKKYLNKEFQLGHGLVGQAAIEMTTIFRTEIPNDYFSITSGILGDQKPVSILIVPLVIDQKVYGVVEFASLKVFTSNHIRFAEEVGPIIARTVFNIMVNERTMKHLEQSQRMTSELQQQQEELRQNAEEMQATQEELKKSNQLLEEQIEEVNLSQKRMQSLLENASEVIVIYSNDGSLKYISPSVKSILGYDSEELIGTYEENNIHEEDWAEFDIAIKNLVSNSSMVITLQYRYKTKNGEWIWLESTGKNMLVDSAVKGIVFNCRDITLKRKADIEERMRKNMQALSENSPDLITRISTTGEIAYINPSIEMYSGLKVTDFISRSIEELHAENAIAGSWNSMLSEVKEKNEKMSKELTYETPIGKRIMQVNVIPEYNNEVMESVLVVSHDITESKLIEMEIKGKNKSINESINYSKRIQNAIMPDNKFIRKIFPQSFILYKPRDVVSGDFPWFMQSGDNYCMAAVDCTGHGVPGAMLSLVGYFQLNNIVETHPELNSGAILDLLDEKVNSVLIRDTNEENIKDGMDIAFCKINKEKMLVEYAGAHRPLYHLSKNGLEELKGNRWAIGGGTYKNQSRFTNYEFNVQKGDTIFFFSDGLPDQFGGTDGRKMGPAKIKNIIQENQDKDMDTLSTIFEEEFNQWKGPHKQTDDVILIGIRF